MVLLDTGPLVSLFNPRDVDHAACLEILDEIIEPLITTEAVLTEVFHMLDLNSRGAEGFKQFLLEGYVQLASLDSIGLQRCFELMSKFRDLPMDFADATLIHLAEKQGTTKIFTLDIKDFSVYRIKKGYRYLSVDIIGL